MLLVHSHFMLANLFQCIAEGCTCAGKYASCLFTQRTLDFLAALYDHFKVTPMLFYVIIKHPISPLTLKFDLFLNVKEVLVDRVNFDTPLIFVKLRFQDLILLSFFKKKLLFLL